MNLKLALNYGTWEHKFINNGNDTNTNFNNFLNTFLRKLYALFSQKLKNYAKFQCLYNN